MHGIQSSSSMAGSVVLEESSGQGAIPTDTMNSAQSSNLDKSAQSSQLPDNTMQTAVSANTMQTAASARYDIDNEKKNE